MIVAGSKLKLNGSEGEDMLVCPSACIGFADSSTLLMLPKVRFWKMAFVDTVKRLMLAVNGLESTNVTEAMPVCATAVGKSREVLVIRFWWDAGLATRYRRNECERK